MQSFSIDTFTGGEADYKIYQQSANYNQTFYEAYGQPYPDTSSQIHPNTSSQIHPDIQSRTASPGDSGIDTSLSPVATPNPSPNVKDDVEQTIAKVSATSETLVTSDLSHEKPPHSFMALVSMAILNSPDRKLMLGDIYRYVMDNFPYYNNDQKAWRNSIRHNLSLNECFINGERAEGGKCKYWSIHPAVQTDFAKGDFRRRQSRRKSRKNVKCSDADRLKASEYATMTPYASYHPYSVSAYDRPNSLPVNTHHVSSPSDQQQTTTAATSSSWNYSPSAAYSDIYKSYYPQMAPLMTSMTSQPTAASQQPSYSQPLTSSYKQTTPESSHYNNQTTSQASHYNSLNVDTSLANGGALFSYGH